jgi:hypothetical protein
VRHDGIVAVQQQRAFGACGIGTAGKQHSLLQPVSLFKDMWACCVSRVQPGVVYKPASAMGCCLTKSPLGSSVCVLLQAALSAGRATKQLLAASVDCLSDAARWAGLQL